MKRINELEKEEILALSPKEIERQIDLECALEGVPLLPPCPQKPQPPEDQRDLRAYGIAGYYFLSPEEAGRVLKVLQSVRLYIKDGWTPLAPLKELSPEDYSYPKVEGVKFYTQEKLSEVKGELEAYDEALAAFQIAQREYEKALEARQGVAKGVESLIKGVKEEEERRRWCHREFQRYLELADQDRGQALNFLLKAHPKVDIGQVTGLCQSQATGINPPTPSAQCPLAENLLAQAPKARGPRGGRSH